MKRSPLHHHLYETSRDLHDQLDSHPLMLGLFSPDIDSPYYLRVLGALRCGLAPMEQQVLAWEAQHGHGALPVYQPRLPALDADIAALGADLPAFATISSTTSSTIPGTTKLKLDGAAAHAGVRYVLEGACRGSVPILKSLSSHAWLSGRLGFWQRQKQLAVLWPQVTGALASLDFDRSDMMAATKAARSVFEGYLQAMETEVAR